MYFLALCIASASSDLIDAEVKTISVEPRLHLVQNFASDEEMDLIITKAFHGMKPQNQGAETGIVYELPVGTHPVFEKIYDRMGSVFPGVADKPFDKRTETFRVRRYLPDGVAYEGGDYHPPHTDWFETDTGDNSNVLIISMILYLTSPEKGGTTYFPHAWHNDTKGFHFQPRRGSLAAWWSCYSNGTQDFTSEHSSEPLLKGIKWNAARFFYDHTKQCSTPAATTVKVPSGAFSVTHISSVNDVPFGTMFPKGVWTSPEGTSTSDQLHGGLQDEDLEEVFKASADPGARPARDGTEVTLAGILEAEKELLRKQAEAEMIAEQAEDAEKDMLKKMAAQEMHEASRGDL